jgi:hypothetical protein
MKAWTIAAFFITALMIILVALFVFELEKTVEVKIDDTTNNLINGERNVSSNNQTVTIEGQEVSLSCKTDSDCVLINKNNGFSCCWAGACDVVDYSLDEYVSVNSSSFYNFRQEFCPSENECGPSPGCPTTMINDNFKAKCVNSLCVKINESV